MKPPSGPRRNRWMPGVALLAGVVAAALVFGLLLGARDGHLYLGLGLALLLGAGGVERAWQRRAVPPAQRARGRLRVIRGGKAYDLEQDDSTDNQRYLM